MSPWPAVRPAVRPAKKESAASAATNTKKPDQLSQEARDSAGAAWPRRKLSSWPASRALAGSWCTPVEGFVFARAELAVRTETTEAVGRTGLVSALLVKIRAGGAELRVTGSRVGGWPMDVPGGGDIRVAPVRRGTAGASSLRLLAKTQSRICWRARSGSPMNRIPASIFVSLVHAISPRASTQSGDCGNWNRIAGRRTPLKVTAVCTARPPSLMFRTMPPLSPPRSM